MVLDLSRVSDADVEHEIIQLSQKLARLKAHLNSRRSVSHLPPEILLHIFSLIVDEWKSELDWDRQRYHWCPTPSSYTWLPITHVFHYWRVIALQTPGLWDHLVLNNIPSISTMLERSQSTPISLFYWPNDMIVDTAELDILEILHPHLYRVNLLQIVSAVPFHYLSRPLFSCSLPSIETITFSIVDDYTYGDELPTNQTEPFTSWMNAGYDALLRVSLCRIPLVGIQAAVRSSLRHLSLHALPFSITMSMLLVLLERTPLLESLSLIHATPHVPSSVMDLSEPDQILTLPHLRSLQVLAAGVSSVNFLRHISYPAMASIEVGIDKLEYLDITPGTLGFQLAAKLPQDLRCISLRTDRQAFQLFGWVGNERGVDLTGSAVSAPCSIQIRFIQIQDGWMSCWTFCNMVLKLLNETLEVLHMGIDAGNGFAQFGQDVWDEEVYNAIITKAINIRKIYISSIHHLLHILPPFEEAGDTRDSDANSQTPLPLLIYLWIENVSAGDVARLNAILRGRERAGKMVEVLSVPYYDGTYQETAGLVKRLEVRCHRPEST